MIQVQGWFFGMFTDSEQQKKTGLKINEQGKVSMLREAGVIKQSIQMLLATAHNERVMRPDYGCKLNQLVFAKNDATTEGLAIHYVGQALEHWEPRIEVLHIDAEFNPLHNERLEILVEYRIKSSFDVDQIIYSLSLKENSD